MKKVLIVFISIIGFSSCEKDSESEDEFGNNEYYDCINGDCIPGGNTYASLNSCLQYCGSNDDNSDNDDTNNNGPTSVTLTNATYDFTGINNCNTSGGYGSKHFMTVYYELNEGSSIIDRYETEVYIYYYGDCGGSGTLHKDIEELTSNYFVFSGCTYFNECNAVIDEIRLKSNGNYISNKYTKTIYRPNGAN